MEGAPAAAVVEVVEAVKLVRRLCVFLGEVEREEVEPVEEQEEVSAPWLKWLLPSGIEDISLEGGRALLTEEERDLKCLPSPDKRRGGEEEVMPSCFCTDPPNDSLEEPRRKGAGREGGRFKACPSKEPRRKEGAGLEGGGKFKPWLSKEPRRVEAVMPSVLVPEIEIGRVLEWTAAVLPVGAALAVDVVAVVVLVKAVVVVVVVVAVVVVGGGPAFAVVEEGKGGKVVVVQTGCWCWV